MFGLLISTVPANATAQEVNDTVEIVDIIEETNNNVNLPNSDGIIAEEEAETANQNNIQAAKTKAIVIIPGILGSSLQNSDTGNDVWLNIFNYSQMALKEDGTSQYNIASVNKDNYGANNTYKTLYNSLNSAYSSNFDVIFFDYDWRLSNVAAASKLAQELSAYSEVVLVAHSMGGLVASRFLANSAANRSKTSALITLGTPYVGSAKCINVMETGELIGISILGMDITLFGNTVKAVCKNSYAAYQLLPTAKYYATTGAYPIAYNGVNYTTSDATLMKTAWSKKSDGTAKAMFATATSFHDSLYTSSVHVKNFNDVTSYTIAMTGHDTISRVNLGADYTTTGLTYSSTGDGTVLYKSAGLGTPDFLYTGPDHTGMVSDSTIIAKVKTLITSATGVAAASSLALVFEENSGTIELDPDNIAINARGWTEGTDNKRINIYADIDSELSIGGVSVEEIDGSLYTSAGSKVGNVWPLGDTGRRLYAMYNNNYTIISSGDIKVEYMNNGYFEKIVEYNLGGLKATVDIEDYSSKVVTCITAEASDRSAAKYYSHVYTDDELMVLNQD
jgi:pimeloyl-ACP methyl ester carboxylesterase